MSSGTTAARARANSRTASSTGPTTWIRESPDVNLRTASGFFPTSRHTNPGQRARSRGHTSQRKNRTADTLGWYAMLPEKTMASSVSSSSSYLAGGSGVNGMALG